VTAGPTYQRQACSLGQLTSTQAETCPPERVNLAEHQIRRKQILTGLTSESFGTAYAPTRVSDVIYAAGYTLVSTRSPGIS
jgi:hypothetical protein